MPSPTLSRTVISQDRASVCVPGLGREEERGVPGHQAVIHHGKHGAYEGQNLTYYFYFISCHKTHFLGGYTLLLLCSACFCWPASP